MMRQRAAMRIASVASAFALVLVVLGVTVHVLLLPAYTRVLTDAVGSAELSALDQHASRELAERVRAYVAGDPHVLLPAALADGRPAFDERAVRHLDDVRDVFAAARWVTLVAFTVAIVWVGWSLRGGSREKREALARSLTLAAWGVAAPIAVVVIVAVVDFGWAFTVFHALFFEPGTWLFPHGELLVTLFPVSFWMASGVAWAALALLAAALLGAAARPVKGSHRGA